MSIEEEPENIWELEAVRKHPLKPKILEETETKEDKAILIKEEMSSLSHTLRGQDIEVTGTLFYPKEVREPLPAVVFCHGGAATRSYDDA